MRAAFSPQFCSRYVLTICSRKTKAEINDEITVLYVFFLGNFCPFIVSIDRVVVYLN